MPENQNIATGKEILHSILNSYSQVFFSTSKLLAVFLVVISFFDYGAGIGGLVAVIIANSLAWGLGYNKYLLSSGLYGFNALLVGLGVGLFYNPSAELYLLIAIAAITCFFFTIVFQGVLGKYGLPYLSVPFLITIWIVALSGNDLSAIHLSERGIYTYNELYAIGGKPFIDFYDFLENNIRSSFINIYFHSLGAIFFQTHLLAGIIIALGLLIYSRITFVLSILGYSIAFLFYKIVGIEFNSLGYTFIGFNYVLTAIALGGYYLVPGKVSFGWIIVLLPAVVLITTSTQQLFFHLKISPYSLPFNMVVLMFLYALKLREKRPKHLIETPVQLGKPEKNLYLYSGNMKRFPSAYPVAASLPFFGQWTVSQGHSGKHTHKGKWRHAWDFIITGNDDKQYNGTGDFPEDYFCFGKAILAPYEGTVVEVVNNVPDNVIGDVNTRQNWGNTVIIKHSEFLFSKLSHLKNKSAEVKKGDTVKQGQVIGKCGNSGRSPYPHLHFQFQETPYIGSATTDYPLGQYLLKDESSFTLKTFDFPTEGQIIANPSKNESLANALHFIPGRQIKVTLDVESDQPKWKKLAGTETWRVETDVYNNTFIRCKRTGSKAYLYNSNDLHYFTNFDGNNNSALFWFFSMLFKVPAGFLPNSKISDTIPLHLMFNGMLKFLQDFVSPVFLFLRAEYSLTIKDSGDILSSGDVKLQTQITKKIMGRTAKEINGNVAINQAGDFEIEIEFEKTKMKMICRNELD